MECKGIITAMVTPLQENQEIDFPATKNLANHLINQGVDGLFVLGTNGEFHVLEKEEKIAFAKAVIEETKKRVPVYVGVGGNGTKEVMDLAVEMEQVGADALSVITPYFVPPSQEELICHYQHIAESVSIPIIIYNMPGKTGINVEPSTVSKLSKIDNIIGIKDSSGKLDNMKAYLSVTKEEEFSVLSGSDSLILDVLESGGAGAVSATSNLVTETIVNIYKNWESGNLEQARIHQLEIEPLRYVLKLGTIPSVLKASLNAAGIPVGPPRLPVMKLNAETMKKIEGAILVSRAK